VKFIFNIKISVVFLRKPSPAEMNTMQKWATEASKQESDMLFNIIHILN
jgi:hypothetical protein